MKLTLNILTFALAASLFASCGESGPTEETPLNDDSNNSSDAVELISDSNVAQIDSTMLNTNLTEEDSASILSEIQSVREEEEGWARYTGEHVLTLQWIGTEDPGTCTFELETEGVFYVVGSQKNENGDELSIDGTLTMQGNEHLLFNGVIKSKVDHLNNGEVCIRNGEYNFKATGKRKYWRLQEMDNCEGGNVVDYIDIYFKR